MRDTAPVVIATFPNRPAADVARGALEERGIEARIIADDAGGLHPEMGLNQGVDLIVKQADAQEARSVLGADRPDAADPSEDRYRRFTRLVAGVLATAVVLTLLISFVRSF